MAVVNPWQVESIEAFVCLKCPECEFDTKEENSFQDQRMGKSLFSLIKDPDLEREIMCEYYATGSISASYMLRKGDFKYIYYLGYGSELYNLKEDPEEINNLALTSENKSLLKEFSRI